jgi:RIO kinase 2
MIKVAAAMYDPPESLNYFVVIFNFKQLVAHSSCEYNGYRLSYLGYDILALHALLARGVVVSVGNQIGVGKESDIFEALDPDGGEVVLKLHRLGRTSFRAVRRSRDYLRGKSKASWLYMSRLAAVKEFGRPSPLPLPCIA